MPDMSSEVRSTNTIELVLTNSAQLFNALSPFPFRDRELAPDVEDYILDAAHDLSPDKRIEIFIKLQNTTGNEIVDSDIDVAIGKCFARRAQSESKAIGQLFSDGRLAFTIGLMALAACLFVGWWISEKVEGPFARVIQESFVIIGWVVIWRPAEIFLYDWLPIVRRRKLYRRLAMAKVTIE